MELEGDARFIIARHHLRLPERGATIIALPMKIGGGSGGPLCIVALLPH